MNKRSKIIAISAAILLAAVVLVAVVRRSSNNHGGDSLRVGVLLPLTGSAAFLGQEERKGIESVKAQLERQIGKPITLIFEDSKNEAKTAITSFVKLWQVDKVDAVIVTHSGVCSALSEYVSQNSTGSQPLPIILATITSSPQITKNNNVFLRVFVSGEDETYAAAAFAAEKLHSKRAAVFYQNDDYGLAELSQFKSNFVGKGGTVVRETPFEKEPKDLRSLVVGLKESSPDSIFVAGNTGGAALLLRELREQKTAQPLLANAILDTKNFRTLIGEEAIKDIYYLVFVAETDQLRRSAPFQEFRSALEKQGSSPNTFTVFPAISLELYVNARLHSPDLKTEQLVQTISTSQHNTLIGTVRFDLARSALLPVTVRQAKGLEQQKDLFLETYTRQ